MKLYIASEYGFTLAGTEFLNILLPGIAQCKIEYVNPWRNKAKYAKEFRKAGKLEYKMRELNGKIAKQNMTDIVNSDRMLACLDGYDVDSGVAGEIGFAYAKGKRIDGFRSDFRNTGDNSAAKINLQIEYFITASGGQIYSDLESLYNMLKFK